MQGGRPGGARDGRGSMAGEGAAGVRAGGRPGAPAVRRQQLTRMLTSSAGYATAAGAATASCCKCACGGRAHAGCTPAVACARRRREQRPERPARSGHRRHAQREARGVRQEVAYDAPSIGTRAQGRCGERDRASRAFHAVHSSTRGRCAGCLRTTPGEGGRAGPNSFQGSLESSSYSFER